jgi:hypothetical protein
MVKEYNERIMWDLGKLFYGKNNGPFTLEKFMQSITAAPVIEKRLLKRKSDE